MYPGYATLFGSYTTPSGTTVAVTANHTTTRNLTVAYQKPTEGALVGTVAVVGARANGGVQLGVEACTAPPTPTSCAGGQFGSAGPGSAYTLALGPGAWWVAGSAFVYSFGPPEVCLSPPKKIAVTAGVASRGSFTVIIC